MNIKNIGKSILKLFIPSNIIVFESIPDLSDNTKAVFDEMVRRGINQKYRLYWMVKNTKNHPRMRNVKYLSDKRRMSHLIVEKARCIICCNWFYQTTSPDRPSFYLSHGSVLKVAKNYYKMPEGITYAFAASEPFIEMSAYNMSADPDKMVALGFPRNDALTTTKHIDIKQILGTDCDKVIVWYPTFRQCMHAGAQTATTWALPILHNKEKAQLLNEFARSQNVLIVMKPHFLQLTQDIKDLHLSNIRFIDDTFFAKNMISSYEFVGKCDALLTDYSSIYYDYTLCDKTIGVVWEDLEDYLKKPGLVPNYEYYMQGAEKIYTLDELCAFVENVANGIDLLKEQRNHIKNIANYAADGKNTERVVDFIIEKAKL